MRYQLQQNHYHNGSVFEVNKLPPRSYFIPYPDRASVDAVFPVQKRYASPLVVCLNGEWDFRFYPCPADLPEVFDTAKVNWEPIAVPGCWQFQGYDRPFYLNARYQFPFDPPNIPTTEKVGPVFALMGTNGKLLSRERPDEEYNFAGVYRRLFHIDDECARYVISFLGVASCLELYVNGQFVGYSEGSHNTAEFDLSGLLCRGENELLAVVRRWCTGSYLECQDMFRNNGIFRDVLLRKGESIRDIAVKTEKEEEGYSLSVSVELWEEKPVVIRLQGQGLEFVSKGKSVSFENLSVQEWTAETPVLYDLYVETASDCVKCRIGFRDICIDGRRFLVNGKAIKFHGVNHHDTSPTAGYVMTLEALEKDVDLCKEYNIDTIRTSHYPPDPYLLELCDEKGIYVVDEADLETHGAFVHRFPPNYGRITHDPFWQKHYLDRGLRLYERDKLHPCIIMWSLGNESGGYRNTDAMYTMLKERTTIPIHYEGAIHSRRRAYDVGSQMYPAVEQVRLVGEGKAKIRQLNDRPYFLCEYAHAMGVGPGAMEEYWKEIYSHEALMGGCIWEMVDHAVLHPNGGYTYGGDHGEWCHDGNFCVDGIFYPDRTPSTGARIAKFVYRPIRVRWLGGTQFEVFNTTGFTCGERYELTFCWSDGRSKSVSPQVAPMEKVVFEMLPPEGAEWVTITATALDSGRAVSVEQLILQDLNGINALHARVPEFPGKFRVEGDRVSAAGFFASAQPHTLLTRAPTDNDRSVTGTNFLAKYLDGREELISVEQEPGNAVVRSRIVFPKAVFLCTDTYEAVDRGVLVTCHLRCEKGSGDLPRFGKCWRLDGAFYQVEYLGRNGESYCDMKDHTQIERVSCTVKEMTEPNLRPQESGNRMDCRFATLTDGRRKVTFTAVNHPFELAVKPYSDRELLKMRHREDEIVTGTYVTVQAFQMGIGTGSCGPATRKEYRFDCKKEYSFSYLISWE